MINDLKFSNEGKLKSFCYSNDKITLSVNVTSFEAVYATKTEEETIGKIIETYRKKRKENLQEAENYFDSKQNIIDNFIKKLEPNSKYYDYVQIMSPIDDRRKNILEQFTKEICSNDNNFSTYFTKTKDLSRVGLSCEESSQYFTYNKPAITNAPKTILIVDDTIDTGCTINIFLDELKKADLITNETEITAIIVYNNFKDNIQKFSLKDIQSKLGQNKG